MKDRYMHEYLSITVPTAVRLFSISTEQHLFSDSELQVAKTISTQRYIMKFSSLATTAVVCAAAA